MDNIDYTILTQEYLKILHETKLKHVKQNELLNEEDLNQVKFFDILCKLYCVISDIEIKNKIIEYKTIIYDEINKIQYNKTIKNNDLDNKIDDNRLCEIFNELKICEIKHENKQNINMICKLHEIKYYINYLKYSYDETNDEYIIPLNNTNYSLLIGCYNREIRKKTYNTMLSYYNKISYPIINETIKLRKELSEIYGYDCYGNCITKHSLLKNYKNVEIFLNNVLKNMKYKIKKSIKKLKKLKVNTNLCENKIQNNILDKIIFKIKNFKKLKVNNVLHENIKVYDLIYYHNLTSQELNKDYNIIKNNDLFSYESVVNGMFEIISEIFDLSFNDKSESYPKALYHKDVKLYNIIDKNTNKEIGYFYLDLYHRENKVNDMCMIKVYNRKFDDLPIGLVLLNIFNKITLYDVESIFHEFGHLLHDILSSQYTNETLIELDFLEIPSIIFEKIFYNVKFFKKIIKQEFHDLVNEENLNKIIDINNYKKTFTSMYSLYYSYIDMYIHSDNDLDIYSYQNKIYYSIFGVYRDPEYDNDVKTEKNISDDFLCLFSSGNSMVYQYIMADIISDEVISILNKNKFNKKICKKLKDEIYSNSSTTSAIQILKNFGCKKLSFFQFI